MKLPEGLTQVVPRRGHGLAGARLRPSREQTRLTDGGGTANHGELAMGDGVVMLGRPSVHYKGPRHHRDECESARRWSQVPFVIDGVLVHVGDRACSPWA